ncbi:CTP synthase [bacterium]|nr:CTP synthase [bacterium]
MTRYIFVTGGVVSSLGKGITAASLGYLLQECGLRVNMLKIDPYLNVDPGTMSPFQHGEVFVTEDGAETDLDLGHYERFLDINMRRDNNVTSGAIYDTIITQERKGKFLGGTVQVVPHVTNEIKSRIKKVGKNFDILITEIGGTTGDIEGLPFLEAVRQFRQEVGWKNVCHLHVTLVPYIQAAGEMKSKPTQQSVAKLREIGIEPQIIVCRTEKVLTKEIKDKIALFCNVREEAVIEEIDVKTTIYEVPLMLKKQNLDKLILNKLGLRKKRIKKSSFLFWEKVGKKLSNIDKSVTIAIAGKYTDLKDAYKSIWESLIHAGLVNNVKVRVEYIDVEKGNLKKELKNVSGILVPGGFGERGIAGKIEVIRYARENNIPFFGICLGMQCAIIEFSRNVCKMKGANSTEFVDFPSYPVITLMSKQKEIIVKGGTMRLGNYPCHILKNSLAWQSYGKNSVMERHRHRYELNNEFRQKIESKGLIVSGEYKKGDLAEIVELKGHPWFLAVQFHPEFKSRPQRSHPLFKDFIKAAKEKRY